MSVQFAVLASGSRGNAAWVEAGGAGLLIDVGLRPRALADRLAAVGASWDRVAAAVLTHTHGDHVSDAALAMLARKRAALFCHDGHRAALARSEGMRRLERAGLVRCYDDRPFLVPGGLRVEPIRLPHDADPTCGFRVEGRGPGRRGRASALGYLADSGCWTGQMADALADVDLLGVEFNHDVAMQRRSGRPWPLIARILGDRGHLSNDQGAALVEAVLARSGPGAVKRVVLLHLSEQCNRPDLALAAAREAVRRCGRKAQIHAAEQATASPLLAIRPGRRLAPAAVGFPWEAA